MDGVREVPSESSDSRLIQVTWFLRYGCSMFRASLARRADIDAEQIETINKWTEWQLKKKTDKHEWPFEHLGTSPSHQDPSTSEEERCQQHGCRADECIRGKIPFELLWRAYPGMRWGYSRMKSKWWSIYHASGTGYSSCTFGVCGPKELDLWRSRSRVWYATLPSLIAFVCPTVSLGANPIHRVLMPVGSNDHQVHDVNDQRGIYIPLWTKSLMWIAFNAVKIWLR